MGGFRRALPVGTSMIGGMNSKFSIRITRRGLTRTLLLIDELPKASEAFIAEGVIDDEEEAGEVTAMLFLSDRIFEKTASSSLLEPGDNGELRYWPIFCRFNSRILSLFSLSSWCILIKETGGFFFSFFALSSLELVGLTFKLFDERLLPDSI